MLNVHQKRDVNIAQLSCYLSYSNRLGAGACIIRQVCHLGSFSLFLHYLFFYFFKIICREIPLPGVKNNRAKKCRVDIQGLSVRGRCICGTSNSGWSPARLQNKHLVIMAHEICIWWIVFASCVLRPGLWRAADIGLLFNFLHYLHITNHIHFCFFMCKLGIDNIFRCILENDENIFQVSQVWNPQGVSVEFVLCNILSLKLV